MKVKIINFMCHKSLELEFSNFQVLFAENGSGKSAIFHAINWLINGGTCNNITKGQKSCSVEIELDNKKIERRVSSSKNEVYLNNELICTTKDSLSKLGIDVRLSFINQFNKLFLLSETPKTRAEIINDMFDIERLENASIECKNRIKDNEKRIKENDVSLKDLSLNETELEKHLKSVIEMEDRNDKQLLIFDKVRGVYNLNKSLKSIPEKIDENIELSLIKKLVILKDLCYTINKLPSKIELTINYIKLEKLYNLVNLINELKEGKRTLQERVLEVEEIENKLKGRCCPLCQKTI